MSEKAQQLVNDYIIRDACSRDIDDIFELSHLLNTVNLPSDRGVLTQVIEVSERSFSLTEADPTKRCFLFVLINKSGRIIGTSQIFAKHGTLLSPHMYFQVEYDERYSETLNKYFRHRVLRLRESFDGPTEIGSLVLEKEYRLAEEKLGQSLSYVRFLFMSIMPECFSHRVLAELLPPLGANFESVLWDAIGRRFTGLDYYEADMISRKNKEFIKSLFPSSEIYVSLLSENAQDVIGQVGFNSRGAAHLLSKIGFSYSHRVDPFDGGPHFEAETNKISLIMNALHGQAISSTNDGQEVLSGLCGRFDHKQKSGERFIACKSTFVKKGGHIELPNAVMNTLKLGDNEPISAIIL